MAVHVQTKDDNWRFALAKFETFGNLLFGHTFRLFLVIIIIRIISLFQEDIIFGMYASLTYGPQLQR